MNASRQLGTADHSRDSAGMTYVYPVVSRRAGGVSIGINLNPNNACNWHCIYCQVPNLVRGAAPAVDLALLEQELSLFLEQVLHSDFLQTRVPEGARRIEDVAFSGNGEATSVREFAQAVEVVERVLERSGLPGEVKLRLITNGSGLDRASVRAGIARLGRRKGEVWFKLDAGSRAAIRRINGVDLDPELILRRLLRCAELCPTWVQTCVFAQDGIPPGETELAAWLALLDRAKGKIAGVHLYGLARPSQQAEAPRLARLPAAWLEALAQRLRDRGLSVCVNP
ncbi:MAG TPA: radical SAM protein [Rhodocyclaceae bacterium]|nr:radical SAM protein [Rhodocyclaceae bacterium]